MFDWIVLKVNISIKNKEWKGIVISVLDIYGFEIFQVHFDLLVSYSYQLVHLL